MIDGAIAGFSLGAQIVPLPHFVLFENKGGGRLIFLLIVANAGGSNLAGP